MENHAQLKILKIAEKIREFVNPTKFHLKIFHLHVINVTFVPRKYSQTV